MFRNKKQVKNKLDELSSYQEMINTRLDSFEHRNDYSFKKNYSHDKEQLNKDLDDLMASMRTGVNINYASFYEDALKANTKKHSKERKKADNTYNTFNTNMTRVKQNKTNENVNIVTEERTRYVVDNEVNENKAKEKERLNLLNLNKSEYHKRQSLYLTNEMMSLRLKLNKMKNKNQLFKNLLNNHTAIKNNHVMEKIIINFIENLAVNWNDIVELLIDDLISDEVDNLNEIELQKSKYNEINIEEFTNEIKKIENNSEIFDCDKFEMDIHEINRIIGEYNSQENELKIKYNKNK
jgi:hypothetical protein